MRTIKQLVESINELANNSEELVKNVKAMKNDGVLLTEMLTLLIIGK